jgi:hypothetical protein
MLPVKTAGITTGYDFASPTTTLGAFFPNPPNTPTNLFDGELTNIRVTTSPVYNVQQSTISVPTSISPSLPSTQF